MLGPHGKLETEWEINLGVLSPSSLFYQRGEGMVPSEESILASTVGMVCVHSSKPSCLFLAPKFISGMTNLAFMLGCG